MVTVASILALMLTPGSISPTVMLTSENKYYPAHTCQGIQNTGVTAGHDVSKPSVDTVAACIAACEALPSCCIAQFNPAHEHVKCDLKNYGTLRPQPAKNVTAITCVPGCPKTPPDPPPHPHPPPSPVPPDHNGTVRISPGDNIGAAVNRAPNGTTFLFAPGVYREVSIIPRPGDIFMGDSPSAEAVVLNGAKLIPSSEVEPVSGPGHAGLFVAANRTETLRKGPGKCDDIHPRCMYTSDLFFDGKPLHHVGSRAAVNETGKWFWDLDSKSIFFFVSANVIDGHALELSVTPTAFGETHSQVQDTPNVTIANMTVQMFASPAQSGAIGGPPGTYWTVTNVVATLNHGAGVAIRDGGKILNSKLLQNGQQGYHSDRGGGILIAENEVAFNNFAGFDQGWEAGAGKLSHDNNDGGVGPGHTHANNERTVLRNNFVHENLGRGMSETSMSGASNTMSEWS